MAQDASVFRKTQPLPDGLAVWPEGEISFNRSPELRVALLQFVEQAQPQRLVVCLEHVPYMDSSGVATLVEAMQAQRKLNRKLILCAMQDRVRSVFEIARLDSVFVIADDLAAAQTM
jgi:anti-anti-sigma factor